jgi:hypothetical protein
MRIIRRAWGQTLPWHRARHVQGLVSAANAIRPDLLVVLKGLHLNRMDVEHLKRICRYVINVNHDDFFSQYRMNRSRDQRAAIPAYDWIFTTREVNVAEIQPLNPYVEFFPFAYEPRIHRVIPLTEEDHNRWACDVLFVGTFAEQRFRLLEQLVAAVPAQYKIYGSGWNKVPTHSPLYPYLNFRELVKDDLAKATHAAKVSLGFLRKENRDDYTQRSFEIPACGGVLLAERTPRHLSFYTEGVEAEFFNPDNPNELIAKVKLLLADSVRRETIRKNGTAKVATLGQTYDDRITRLAQVLAPT